ncbi:MAG: hypothetical protein ABEJ67_01150 [Halanaeroarchaeum sp.]
MTSTRHTFCRRLLAVCFVVLLSVPTTGLVAASPDAGATTSEDVQFARTMEEMRAHLSVSLQYARANETADAAEHAAHPVEEYWSVVSTDIRRANESLASDLHDTLLAAPDHARNDTAQEYATFLQTELYPLMERATTAVVGETDATFSAKVTVGLLERATAEYHEGVAPNGSVVDQEEYADASAFATRAEAVYADSVRGTLDEHARSELDELFERLQDLVNRSVAPDEVERIVDSIGSELAEYTGIEYESSASVEAIERIESDLHEAVEAYENGNVDEAQSVVRQTYLSNFEGVEGTLIEKNPGLVGELEAAFNEELPGLMERGASVERVREKVEQMETKLSTAADILAAQGTTTIDLGDDETSTSTTTTTTTTMAPPTTATTTPGFTVLAGLLGLVGALLLSRIR